ncbi:DUF3291 domain-containing protein [Nocardiopsis sp. NPDC050513]|uniref:DUF3291 domain-containing protein n=1 Tax=Nocardiopsis sp. NPDC050513 TaxID=3364338 RepID=UPI00379E4659
MPSVIPHTVPHQHTRVSDVRVTRVPEGPVLVESLLLGTPSGDDLALDTLVAALRDRAQGSPGYLGEVRVDRSDGRRRAVALWRSPTDLRSFVHAAHPDLLSFRATTGEFPTAERTLWWSPEGAAGVTVDEAERRAAHLREHGPGARAFTLSSPVPVPA